MTNDTHPANEPLVAATPGALIILKQADASISVRSVTLLDEVRALGELDTQDKADTAGRLIHAAHEIIESVAKEFGQAKKDAHKQWKRMVKWEKDLCQIPLESKKYLERLIDNRIAEITAAELLRIEAHQERQLEEAAVRRKTKVDALRAAGLHSEADAEENKSKTLALVPEFTPAPTIEGITLIPKRVAVVENLSEVNPRFITREFNQQAANKYLAANQSCIELEGCRIEIKTTKRRS